MRAWEFYHSIIDECKKYGMLEENRGFIEDYPKVAWRGAMCEDYDDPKLNDYIENYPLDDINDPKKGTWTVGIYTSNALPTGLKMRIIKSSLPSDGYGRGGSNKDILKYKNVGVAYFYTEQDAIAYIMGIKMQFSSHYDIEIK